MPQEKHLIPPPDDRDSETNIEPVQPATFEVPEVIRIKYEAPLPPPGMLREFEDILPGAADRIFTVMEEQTHHRHHLESTQQAADISSERRSQFIGGLIAFIALTAGFFLIYKGKSIPGTIVFITTCASLIGVFIAGRWAQKKEREDKSEQLVRAIARAIKSAGSEPPDDDFDTEG
jgi:uncharacterized membrane protein